MHGHIGLSVYQKVEALLLLNKALILLLNIILNFSSYL